MKGAFRLGTVAGIKIFIHWTFAILILYLIYSNYRKGYDASQTGWSILFVLSIFVTVFLHELGHALMAKRFHIKTTDITMLPIGGLARLERIPEKPSEELLVALAGPAVNIVLAIITGLLIDFPEPQQLNEVISAGVNAGNFFLNFFIVNIWLAIFNLIPAFPMDGGRVLRALLSMKFERHIATNIAARVGQFLAVVFIFVGFFTNPFLVFIGLFIFLGAQAEAAMINAQALLKGYTVKDVLMKDIPMLNAGDPLRKAVDLLLNTQNKNFVVMENGLVAGTLGRDEIIKALSVSGEQQTINMVMNRELVVVNSSLSLDEAYSHFKMKRVSLLLVKDAGQLKGVVDLENILEFVMVKNTGAGDDTDRPILLMNER